MSLIITYIQAIQEAVLKAGVPQRLGRAEDDTACLRQDTSFRNSASPRSTITFHAEAEAAAEQQTPAVRSAAGQLQRTSQPQGNMGHEVCCHLVAGTSSCIPGVQLTSANGCQHN